MDPLLEVQIPRLHKEISSRQGVLESRVFKSKSEFARIQGEIRGLRLALEILKSTEEEDES